MNTAAYSYFWDSVYSVGGYVSGKLWGSNKTSQATPVVAKFSLDLVMGFANLDSDSGVAILNDYLADKSYIEGFNASQADVAVFEALKSSPSQEKRVHAARWYTHIKSMSAQFASYRPITCAPLY